MSGLIEAVEAQQMRERIAELEAAQVQYKEDVASAMRGFVAAKIEVKALRLEDTTPSFGVIMQERDDARRRLGLAVAALKDISLRDEWSMSMEIAEIALAQIGEGK
jgi:hypothetical protein